MTTPTRGPELGADRPTRDEFGLRYAAMPEVEKAESKSQVCRALWRDRAAALREDLAGERTARERGCARELRT